MGLLILFYCILLHTISALCLATDFKCLLYFIEQRITNEGHKSVLTSFGLETSNDELDVPFKYWIRNMHKNPYIHRFIAASSKCSTKPLSILLKKTCLLILSKIEKVPRGIRGEKSSKDMASSRNSVSIIGALASPKMGDGTRCPEG